MHKGGNLVQQEPDNHKDGNLVQEDPNMNKGRGAYLEWEKCSMC